MKTNVLVGWCKEIYDVAVEKFPARQFSFKELRTAIEWEEYHPDVKSLDAVLLANLQTLRNREVVTFVSRGVYQLTGATAPVIESTVGSSDIPKFLAVTKELELLPTAVLTASQSIAMEEMVHGATLVHRTGSNKYSIVHGLSATPVNFMVARSIVSKGFVRELSSGIEETVYGI